MRPTLAPVVKPSPAGLHKPVHGGYPGQVSPPKPQPVHVPGSFGDGACGMR